MSDIISSSTLNQTELWLHSRLAGEGRWDTAGIGSSFTSEKLADICEIFSNLDSKLKLKLLLSFLEIHQRNIGAFTEELNGILSLACNDSDDWVRVTGHIISHLPTSNSLKHDLNEHVDGIDDIKRQVKQVSGNASACHLLPIDFPYLNRSVISHQKIATPIKHFTLKRKPKSAALRAQLTQRESHRRPSSASATTSGTTKRVADGNKEHNRPSHTAPHVPRSSGQSTVFARSLANSSIRSTSRATIGKKTKLLDITEQPISSTRESKKRKKQSELEASIEEVKAKKLMSEESSLLNQPEQPHLKSTTISDTVASEVAPLDSEPVPSYAVLPQTVLNSARNVKTTTEKRPVIPKQPRATPATADADSIIPLTTQPSKEPSEDKPVSVAARPVVPKKEEVLQRLLPEEKAPLPPPPPLEPASQPSSSGASLKKGLSLTREQMIAAQEMFRSANRVTRPEKALILGFMAGARDNPFPHQGPVITIKLSETTEDVQVPGADGPSQQTVLVEMLFEMNYNTGHWRRLKRTRTLAQQQQFNS